MKSIPLFKFVELSSLQIKQSEGRRELKGQTNSGTREDILLATAERSLLFVDDGSLLMMLRQDKLKRED